jgi:hypothetical protein
MPSGKWVSLVKTPTPDQVVRLRSEPMTVSPDEVQKVFGLDANWQPIKYMQHEFVDQGEVVLDRATGLTWQKSGSLNYVTYEDAQAYIKQLNTQKFAGYNDWRLPTIPELMSLLEPTQKNGDLFIDPVFDKTQKWCWSVDTRMKGEGSADSAWRVGFYGGNVRWLRRYGDGWVRAVRS